MYLKMIVCIVLFSAFILVVMNIIEGKIRSKRIKKILWNIDNMDKRDKVETRTGGLSHDRIYERNPDTGKIRSRKSGDYGKEIKE
tara:strand:+ start:91 stop:345 length:255 start_codon:yes stop_codon:yes gene_type:complete